MVRDCTHKISHKCEYSLELVKGEVTHSCSSLTPSKVLLLSSSQVPRQCSFQTTTGLTSSLECLSADQTISSFRFLLQMNLSKTINYNIKKKKSGKCCTQNLFFGFKTAQNHYLCHLKIAKAKAFRTIVALHFLKRRVFCWLHLFFGMTRIKLF